MYVNSFMSSYVMAQHLLKQKNKYETYEKKNNNQSICMNCKYLQYIRLKMHMYNNILGWFEKKLQLNFNKYYCKKSFLINFENLKKYKKNFNKKGTFSEI